MLVGSFILSLIILAFLIFSPCIFKAIFKNKICCSYGIGFFAGIIYTIILSSLGFIIPNITYKTAENTVNTINNNLNKFDLDKFYSSVFSYRLYLWLCGSVPQILLLLILLCFIKMAAQKERGFSFIFMFLSGFNLIFFFLFLFF